MDIAETNLKNTTETHLKEKEQFSIAIRKSKEANTEVSKVRERYALLALDNQALTTAMEDSRERIGDLKSEVYKLKSLADPDYYNFNIIIIGSINKGDSAEIIERDYGGYIGVKYY